MRSPHQRGRSMTTLLRGPRSLMIIRLQVQVRVINPGIRVRTIHMVLRLMQMGRIAIMQRRTRERTCRTVMRRTPEHILPWAARPEIKVRAIPIIRRSNRRVPSTVKASPQKERSVKAVQGLPIITCSHMSLVICGNGQRKEG